MIGSRHKWNGKMPKISFFNYYHNGDLFVSKSFIKQIVDELPSFEFSYYHLNNPKTIQDLIPYGGQPDANVSSIMMMKRQRFIYNDDEMVINTWIGIYIEDQYPEPPYFWNGGINYVALYNIWDYIFSKINEKFGTNLKIKDSPKDYISFVDHSKFELDTAKAFLEARSDTKKVLFSNGVPMSGQSFSDNMEVFINNLAINNPKIDFICTSPIATTLDNVFFTNDILKLQSDLNEISYLSKFCDLIVGKNSGPFIYCLEKENFTNPNKMFVSFNHMKEDSLDYGIEVDCDYTCSQSKDAQEIYNILARKVAKI